MTNTFFAWYRNLLFKNPIENNRNGFQIDTSKKKMTADFSNFVQSLIVVIKNASILNIIIFVKQKLSNV